MIRRTRRGVLAVLMVVALLVGVFAVVPSVGATPVAAPPTTQMVICLDASNSIDSATWDFMTAGVAQAIKTVVPHDGSVELGVNKFGYIKDGTGFAEVVVNMQVINSDAVANAIAADVASEGKTDGWTPTGMAIDLAMNMMQTSGNFAAATRHIINVVTDGEPAQNADPGYKEAKDAAIAARGNAIDGGCTELNAELVPAWDTGVIADADVNWWLESMVYPEPGKIAPPFDPAFNGFVAKCYNATDIVNAIKGKLVCGTLTLDPLSARNPFNTDHTVTATLTDALGNPIPGAEIRFEVIDGPNKGISGTVVTDNFGNAKFKYTDSKADEDNDTDTIQATHGCASDTATKTWHKPEEPPPVPSVTEWGLIATVIAVAATGVLLLYRRQASVRS